MFAHFCIYYLKHCREFVRKIKHEGACREINTARGKAECCIRFKTIPECYFSRIAQAWQCFIWFKVFLVVSAMAFIWQTRTASIFSHQTIGESFYSTGLGVKLTDSIVRLLLGFNMIEVTWWKAEPVYQLGLRA